MPNPYADMVARIILQAAEANAEAAAREQDRAMRREEFQQNLALQREELGFRRSESEARRSLAVSQDAREKAAAEREAEKFRIDTERQQQDDAEIEAAATLADNPDAMLGVKPLSESVGGKVKLRATEFRARKAKAEDEIAAAKAAPAERDLSLRSRQAALDASEAQRKQAEELRLQQADNFQFGKSLREIQAASAGVDLETQRLKLRSMAEEHSDKVLTRKLNNIGVLTGEQRLALKNQLIPMVTGEYLRIAQNKATTYDINGKPVTDDAVLDKELANLGQNVDALTKALTLDKTDPAMSAKLKETMKKTAAELSAKGATPKVIEGALLGLINAAIPDKKPGDDKKPPPPNPNAESQRRLSLKTSAESQRNKGIVGAVQALDDETFAKLDKASGGNKSAEEIASFLRPFIEKVKASASIVITDDAAFSRAVKLATKK